MENKNSSYGGVGIFGLLSVFLTVAFVVLKICGAITWSWVWVLSPLWIYFVGVIVFVVLMTILYIVYLENRGRW